MLAMNNIVMKKAVGFGLKVFFSHIWYKFITMNIHFLSYPTF